MRIARWTIIAKISWLALCIFILLTTQPWQGGENGVVFFFLLIFISFPFGGAGAALYALASDLTRGTSFEHQMCCTALWWSSYFAVQTIFGYIQWFVAVPLAWAGIKRVLTSRSKTDAPPASGAPLS